MNGLTADQQIIMSLVAVLSAVLGFFMAYKVRFVRNEQNKDAPGLLCFFAAVGAGLSTIGLVNSGQPIVSGGLFVSSLVLGVSLGFMTERR